MLRHRRLLSRIINPLAGRRRRAACLRDIERLEDRRLLTAGSLDLSFGDGGKAITEIIGSARDSAIDVVVTQPDGKTVVLGLSGDVDGERPVLVRYNVDGSLDGDFGAGGIVLHAWPEADFSPAGMAVDGLGRILVAGSAIGNSNDFAVLRFTASGNLDTTFGPGLDADGTPDGRVLIDFGGTNDLARGIFVDSQGRIVVAGNVHSSTSGIGIARLDGDGALDTTFGQDRDGDGILDGLAVTTTDRQISDVAMDRSDRLVVLSSRYSATTLNDFLVFRFDTAGGHDASFGQDGITQIDLGDTMDYPSKVAIDLYGRVAVLGVSYKIGPNSQNQAAIVRLTTSGLIDTTFGQDRDGDGIRDGSVIMSVGSIHTGTPFAFASDRQLRFLLAKGPSVAGAPLTLYRFDSHGQLDATFGQDSDGDGTLDGIAYTDTAPRLISPASIAVDGSGFITIAGSGRTPPSVGTDIALLRYDGSGALDTTFGNGGIVVTNLPGRTVTQTSDLLLTQTDGKMIVVGENFSSGDGRSLILVRYNPNGTLDTTFGNGGSARTSLGRSPFNPFGRDHVIKVASLDSSGRILVVGSVNTLNSPRDFRGDFVLFRFNADGTPDLTFGQDLAGDGVADGRAYTSVLNDDREFSVVVDSLGRIVVAGNATGVQISGGALAQITGVVMARYDQFGQLDKSFGSSGTGKVVAVSSNASTNFFSGGDLAIDGADRLVVSGQAYDAAFNHNFAVARFHPDGSLDTTFGDDLGGDGVPDGVAYTSFGAVNAYANAVTIDAAGRIVVAGDLYSYDSATDSEIGEFAVARYNIDGSPDTTFGRDADGDGTRDGRTTVAFADGFGFATTVAIDPAGRIVLGGGQWYYTDPATYAYKEDLAIARLGPDGDLDLTFGNGGTVTTDLGLASNNNTESVGALAVDSLGRIIVAAYTGYGDIALVRYLGGELILQVNPATIAEDLQRVVSGLDTSTSEPLPDVVLAVDPGTISSVLDAIANLVVDPDGPVIDIVLNLADGTYSGLLIDIPPGVRLILVSGGTTFIFVGASPALTLNSGALVVDGATFVNATDASTILVVGGSLTLRNSTISETTSYDRAAIEVVGGTLDLGTAVDPGNNTLIVNGPGELIRNTSSGAISAIGNTFQIGGTDLLSNFRIEDEIIHALDASGFGLVTWVSDQVFVTAVSGSIQRGVDAVALGGTVNVEMGAYADYTVGTKLLTIAFEGGPSLSQQIDPLTEGTMLQVVGTAGNDLLRFESGSAAGAIVAAVNGLPQATFMPTGRLIADGQAGDDDIQVAGSIGLSAWLFGGDGYDRLKASTGDNVLIGGDGNDLLIGGGGRDLMVGGKGADRLIGNAGDDILIAGFTAFDSNQQALGFLMKEWTSTRVYETRIGNLSGLGTGDRANGNYFLWAKDDVTGTLAAARTVFDDDDKDVLIGGADADWFFFDRELDRDTDSKDELFANDLDWINFNN